MIYISLFLFFVFLPLGPAFAAEALASMPEEVMSHPLAFVCIVILVLSYAGVLLEEKTHMKKSKPVMLGAALIWICIGILAPHYNITHDQIHQAVMHGLEEYAALFLFLLAAMTFISALQERQVFDTLRYKMVKAGFNMREIFWLTGLCAFFLSPIADNMTTALVMGAVVMAVGANDPKFVAISCINIVSAANAGGAFSPFGDITTLMVWQAGILPFFDFMVLFVPSFVCFIIPAAIMSRFVVPHKPLAFGEEVRIRRGGKRIIALGIATIAGAVSMEQFLGIPPFMGMMAGMAVLMMFSYFVQHVGPKKDKEFDILQTVALAEWDTLLFFFGIMFCISGIAYLGYMEFASIAMYGTFGPTVTNIGLGFLSAILDNIPLMFAVITMNPDMSEFQWLLVTLTTGVGGTMLSIGSAAGVALMGISKGKYTFLSHLKWTPVIILGYVAAIAAHFALNGSFDAK